MTGMVRKSKNTVSYRQELWPRWGTNLQVVEGVELHQVVKPGEGFVGVLEIEGGKWRLGIIKDVKICKVLLLLRLPWNTWNGIKSAL